MNPSSFSSITHDDNNRLDTLFLRYLQTRTRDSVRAAELFREFHSGLLRHISWEENDLFPLFEERTGMVNHGPTAVMRAEHRQILDHAASIGRALTGGRTGDDSAERALLLLLTLHNRKEEQMLSPAIDRSLGDRERAGVLAALLSVDR